MSELLRDRTFEYGFNVLRRSLLENNHDELMELSFHHGKPEWRLAEYFSHYDFYTHRDITEKDGFYRISNEGKEIIREKDGSLTLSIHAETEYDHPRVDGEPWPHLLIEEEFFHHHLKTMKHLRVHLTLDFLALESFMNQTRNDLHTLQVSLYFALGSRNKNSKGYQDFYWFGLPFIDAPRYHFPKQWINQDIGKEDATNKLIYTIDPHVYMKEEFRPGDTLTIDLDILPYMLNAFQTAKEKSYIQNVPLEDVEILSLNFGYEVTGSFNGKMKLSDFSIEEDTK